MNISAMFLHASQLILATDATWMHREENSCLQLCLHPSLAVNGDVKLLALQQERAFTSVGCNQAHQSSTGARLLITYTHLAPTQQTTNGSVNQPGLIWSSMHSGKFSTFACTRCSCATLCTRFTWVLSESHQGNFAQV
jgi:hypothetical protein